MSIGQRLTDPVGYLVREIMLGGIEAVFRRYYGTYRGIVLDPEDPLDLGRVRVMVPRVGWVDAESTPAIWARCSSMGGGSALKWVPDKGASVWVRFESGRLEHPLYGLGWGRKGRSDIKELAGHRVRGFRTSSGHVFRIEDAENGGGILLARGNGKGAQGGTYVQLADDGTVVVASESGGVVHIGESVVSVVAPDGSTMSVGDDSAALVSKSGAYIGASGGNISIGASGGIDIKASGRVSIDGSGIDIGGPGGEAAMKGETGSRWMIAHSHVAPPLGGTTSPPIPAPPPPVPGAGLSIKVRIA
jgi:hypothetical protein